MSTSDIIEKCVKPTNPDYILEVHTVQVQGFKGTLEAIKDLLNECNIHFDKYGMKIKTIDGRHIALVHIRYDYDKFDFFYCERDLSIGVNIANLLKVLKNVGQNDTLQLFVKRDDYDRAGIRIQNAEKGAVHEFYIKLMDLDDNDIDIPETEFANIISMPSSDLHSLCKQYKEFATEIDIKSVGDKVIFSFTGQETTGKSILHNNENGLLVQKVDIDGDGGDEIVQAKFILKYLVLFSKAYNLSNTVEIFLKNDYPMVLKYTIADLGTLKYCLAPMVEEN